MLSWCTAGLRGIKCHQFSHYHVLGLLGYFVLGPFCESANLRLPSAALWAHGWQCRTLAALPLRPQEHLDLKILRFYCCWDDTKRMFGQKLPFALHYYLRDDTVEVAESHMRNTGRDPFPLLLSRCKLPRTPNVPPVGACTLLACALEGREMQGWPRP